MNLCKVLQCQEKVLTRALSLLKVPTSAFTIKNLLRREIGMLVWLAVLWNFMKVRWQVWNCVWPAPAWWCCRCPGAASWPPLSEDAPDPRAPEVASPPCHPARAPGHSGKYFNMPRKYFHPSDTLPCTQFCRFPSSLMPAADDYWVTTRYCNIWIC